MKSKMKIVNKLEQVEQSLSTLQYEVHDMKTAFEDAQLTAQEKLFVTAMLKKLKKGEQTIHTGKGTRLHSKHEVKEYLDQL